VRDIPGARQPARPCQALIRKYDDTLELCEDPVMRVSDVCILDMADIRRLLIQDAPLPCDWHGDVICSFVAGVLREGGIRDKVVVRAVENTDEFQIDDFVTVATEENVEEKFYLARVLEINLGELGDELKLHWFTSRFGQEFGSYTANVGSDHGRDTDIVSADSCRFVECNMDARSRHIYRITQDQYGRVKNAILVAMAHGRAVQARQDLQDSQRM
jgi:hypothetical protein